MKSFKKPVVTAFFAMLALFASCSNNTEAPSTSAASSSTTQEEGLIFNGDADGVAIKMLLADNYLESVLNGNPYQTTPLISPVCDYPTVKTEVRISNLDYYGKKVDLLCEKDASTYTSYSNSFYLKIIGSDANGIVSYYRLCWELGLTPNTGYYHFYQNGVYIPQGTDHEMSYFLPQVNASNNLFICNGSDGNEYEAEFYTQYHASSVNIPRVFDVTARKFTGVVSVNLRNYYDQAIDLFFE